MLVFTFLLFYHLRFGIDPVYQSWLFDTCSNYPQFTHAAIHPPWICIQLSDWLKCFGYKVKMSEWVLQQLPSRLNPMGTMGGERMSFTTLERMSYRGGECILKQRTSDTNIVRALLSMQVVRYMIVHLIIHLVT